MNDPLTEGPVSVEATLRGALDTKPPLAEVLILGRDENGLFYGASSFPTGAEDPDVAGELIDLFAEEYPLSEDDGEAGDPAPTTAT